ncbi:HAMP domain-containing sensor histidine kinase [Neisseria polysaccharea]|uniref:HAMP domain-containing sensor histidine kinase n=1 Tax=Neisseria polysaccharea TaxID=489 RepID=UPI0027DF736B|nr:HAMP domain-containing sensor histidine kinase [Neisseria polysaccharea]
MVISNPRELEKLKDRIPNLINIIRVAIVFPLMIMHILGLETGSRANLHASWTAWAFYVWLAIACWLIFFSIIHPHWQWQSLKMPRFSAVADITMIGVLTYLFGGIDSGFGILILPFVVCSCLLSYGRYPLLYSSYAAILLIFNAIADGDIGKYPLISDARTASTTFILVAASYLSAIFTSLSVKYIDRAGKLAYDSHIAYHRIKGLSQTVLERVQEAVVVINTERLAVLFNRKAKDLFPALEIGRRADLSDSAAELWNQASPHNFEYVLGTPGLNAGIRAVPVNKGPDKLLILYIRPQSEIQAEALSVKLAALGQLTANLAHEIRNPMSAIRHANDLLRENMEAGAADPFHAKLCKIIDGNVCRIDKMLEDISSLNKRNKTERQAIDLMPFWAEFKQEFLLGHPDAAGCIRLDIQGGSPSAYFDPAHLRQIIWNLTNNAWRHSSRQPGSISVTIRPAQKNTVGILFADDGGGVPPEVQEHLFEPFYTTAENGTGLGLYVARELAHANFGDLTYLPEAKCFELTLPEKNND